MFDGVENGFLSLPTKFYYCSVECFPIFVVVHIFDSTWAIIFVLLSLTAKVIT